MERITESVYASGTVISKNQYQVFSTVAGLVQQVFVKEGDLVKKGDPLFVIQGETSKLNTENAQLSADYAETNTRGERLTELKTAIETARSKMPNDSLLLQRQRGLWAQQIGSKVELEQRELAYTNSMNTFLSTISRYKDLQKQLGFAAAQAQKLLSISKSLQKDFVVRSQTDGRIYSVFKELGEIVNQQTPVAIIGDAETFVVELQVDENDIVRVKPGQRVLISMDSYKGEVFEAVVKRVNPYMNERSRTFTVEADFVQKPLTLYPNLTTEANILIQTRENVLTIPRAFLVQDSMVIMADKTSRKVTLGLKDYQKAEILSGLSQNETILKPSAQ